MTTKCITANALISLCMKLLSTVLPHSKPSIQAAKGISVVPPTSLIMNVLIIPYILHPRVCLYEVITVHFHYITQNLKFYGAMLRKEIGLWSQKTLVSNSNAAIYNSGDFGKII